MTLAGFVSSPLHRRIPVAFAAIFFAGMETAAGAEPPSGPSSTPASAPAPAAPPAPPAIATPPAPRTSTDVPYPLGASGDAVVLLVLDIDAQGRVTDAIVTDGIEPFAEQARRAVLGWTFMPARRGDVAVAARIRARVAFHQEIEGAPPASTPASSSKSTPIVKPRPPDAVEEVVVRGARHEIGETTLTADDVREMPGAFGDPFRAIEAMPGVTPVVSGLPFFYIRGAPPTDNLYTLDGIRVPLLFHVGIGEAVIHPALVDHVDFYPGAAPASFGHTAGAVISGVTREPSTVPHGQVDLRLIDAGALLESPFANGHGTALASARYGYPGPILSAVTSTVKLGYWDYQTRVTWKTSDRDTIGVFAFGSHDYLGTAGTKNGETQPITDALISDFHRVDLRYDHRLSGGRVRVATTLGYDSLGGTGGGDGEPAVTTVTNLSFASRLEIEKDISREARVRGGADVELDHWAFAQAQIPIDASGASAPQVPSSANPPPTNLTWGAHADVVWHLTDRVEIVPGVRFDVFDSVRSGAPAGTSSSTTVPAFEPRLSTRVKITNRVAWLSSFGISHQYPVLRVGSIPAVLVSVPGFPAHDAELQTAAQASQGIELALPADVTLTTTAFLSGRTGLTDLTASCTQILPATVPAQNSNMGAAPSSTPYVCPSDGPVHQHAYGVEILLRRPLSKRLTGWLSYTFARSVAEERFVTPTGGQAIATIPSDYDRTHVLNAIAGYDLGRRWRAGARFVLLSGTPYSNESGNVPVPPYNAYRDPVFFRVDVRLEKRWPFLRTGYFAFIAEVQNVTLSSEVTPLAVDCEGTMTAQGGTNQCRHGSVGPITIPSIGVEAAF